jgi:integrase
LEHIAIKRAVWHTVESTPKTPGSVRFVTVPPELREVLLSLWNDQGSPMGGYILARADGGRVNLDNMAKRTIIPTLEKVEPEPLAWHGFYALRRFHGTGVRSTSGSSDTASKALGNSKEVADRHYIKPQEVFPDVRKAVNEAVSGLTVEQPLCN